MDGAAVTDLASLTADQLAEKVRWWGDADDRAALAELQTRANHREALLIERDVDQREIRSLVVALEAAEKERDEAVAALYGQHGAVYGRMVAAEKERDEAKQRAAQNNANWKEAEADLEVAEARVAETRKTLEAADAGLQAALAHAEGLRMDTDEDESLRLKVVETLRLARAALTTHHTEG